jgi:hypothetical protein
MQWWGSILCRYKLCSGVAAYYVKPMLVCMLCVVQNETLTLHYTLHTHQYRLDIVCCHTTA